MKSKGVRGKGG